MTEIKAGKSYMCLRDIKGYESFTKGKIYPSLYDNALINDNHIEVLVRPSDYFRIATEQEIKAQKGDEQSAKTTTGTEMIREERLRQIEAEGYDALHDRHHTPQVLCRAAVSYALYDDQSALIGNSAAKLWPWSNKFWKPKDHLRNLVRAGALIAAAIDKLQSEKGE